MAERRRVPKEVQELFSSNQGPDKTIIDFKLAQGERFGMGELNRHLLNWGARALVTSQVMQDGMRVSNGEITLQDFGDLYHPTYIYNKPGLEVHTRSLRDRGIILPPSVEDTMMLFQGEYEYLYESGNVAPQFDLRTLHFSMQNDLVISTRPWLPYDFQLGETVRMALGLSHRVWGKVKGESMMAIRSHTDIPSNVMQGAEKLIHDWNKIIVAPKPSLYEEAMLQQDVETKRNVE